MAFWFAPVGAAIGGFVGKVLGKVAEWVPSKEQYNRNKIEALERERDEILREGIPNNKRVRLTVILTELRRAESDLKNR
jgi:hypothetical protein